MSYNNAKVNPFYIQDDEEEAWEDDEDYDDCDYDDEQVMLMSGSGGIKNRKYNNDSGARSTGSSSRLQQHNYNNNSHYSRSYHNGQYETRDSHLQHRPQLWKYGFLFVTILGVIVFGTSFSSESDHGEYNVSLGSLVDEIPNNEISNEEYKIVVLGERHSGTAWMRERLRECFPHVEVSNHLQRMGYFFQDDEATARSKAENSEALATIHDTNTTTIVVHVTLNVYDWLEQMRLSPEYAPDHAGKHQQLNHPVPLGWREFLSKPWTTERPDSDLELVNATGPVCQMGFGYDEVVSCSQSAKGIGDPMYELHDNGKPFGSIIDLRTAKLKNHHGVLESWPSVKKMIVVPYETTAQDFKTKLLKEILEFTGWTDVPCNGDIPPPSLDSSKGMTEEFVDFVSERADWETEQSVASYSKWTGRDINSKNIPSKPIEKDSTQDETEETTTSSENESSPEAPKEQPETSVEVEKETEADDENAESSNSGSNNSSQTLEEDATTTISGGETSKSKSSTVDSSGEEEPTEETESPPAEEDVSSSDKSSAADEIPDETDESSKDSTKNSPEDKEEKLSSKDSDETDPGKESNADAEEEKPESDEAELPDDNTKPNEESLSEEKAESESTSHEDLNVEEEKAPAGEKENETKVDSEKADDEKDEDEKETSNKSADESKSATSDTETSKSDGSADDTKSESDENDGKR
eukprot:CAMPEP_0116095266 /NCGR_PEP_ID=MMETSP0327-20121206/9572_1 /TAXON_ID=44447 /ORGANISM="Pseudo-nitzschia delicatissima, Strain B596" /LENGTH=696 /DNA_ID=CAMNT_0003586923 /DNA_START=180 /DNA_END=2270 /DNA_ORIENTATION=-